MSFTELDVDHDEDILMSVKKRNNERTSFESSDMNDIDDDESNSHSKRGICLGVKHIQAVVEKFRRFRNGCRDVDETFSF